VSRPEDDPGNLGAFDADASIAKVPKTSRLRARLIRSIRAHDLSAPAAVPESYGSGVILDRSGLVLTNAHVVRNATKVYVRLSGGRGAWADVHASDPRSDLAVLRLLPPVPEVEPLPLGDAGKARPGTFLVALANEFSPGFRDGRPTAGWGMVTNLRRRAPGDLEKLPPAKRTLHHYGTLIQTDARVRYGCSGGALLNLEGEVIGLTTVLAAVRGEDAPGAQAVPIDRDTQRIVAALKRGEEVEYGFLGVTLSNRDGEKGVTIDNVTKGSPARQAGILGGDRIVAVNGKVVRDNNDLFLLVGMALAGHVIDVTVVRDGERHTFKVRLAKYYVPGPIIASRRPPARGGLRVDYTSILVQRNPFALWGGAGVADGVAIREVLPNSPADKADLQPDKVITRVDGQAVHTPAEFYAALARAKGRVELTVLTSEGRPEVVPLSLK
jgi:S1-C subfamily serine protease